MINARLCKGILRLQEGCKRSVFLHAQIFFLRLRIDKPHAVEMALLLFTLIDMQRLAKDRLIHEEIEALRIQIAFQRVAPLLVQNLQLLAEHIDPGASRKPLLQEFLEPRHLGAVFALPPLEPVDLRAQFVLPRSGCRLLLFQKECAALHPCADLSEQRTAGTQFPLQLTGLLRLYIILCRMCEYLRQLAQGCRRALRQCIEFTRRICGECRNPLGFAQ